MTMFAYHSDDAYKAAVLAHAREHREQDKLVKGTYWDGGKGCAVGCTLRSVMKAKGLSDIEESNHRLFETHLGIPVSLARLDDGLFEALPDEASQAWPERFLAAIPAGADLSKVVDQFVLWLLIDEREGVVRFADERGAQAIRGVADLYARRLRGEAVSTAEWERVTAEAARAAWAAEAAGAARAAWAAEAARAARAAGADKLIELLAAAPLPQPLTIQGNVVEASDAS